MPEDLGEVYVIVLNCVNTVWIDAADIGYSLTPLTQLVHS